jgi:hypothetical protein
MTTTESNAEDGSPIRGRILINGKILIGDVGSILLEATATRSGIMRQDRTGALPDQFTESARVLISSRTSVSGSGSTDECG